MTTHPTHWTPKQLARSLNVNVQTIRRAIAAGVLPAVNVSMTAGRPTWRISSHVAQFVCDEGLAALAMPARTRTHHE